MSSCHWKVQWQDGGKMAHFDLQVGEAPRALNLFPCPSGAWAFPQPGCCHHHRLDLVSIYYDPGIVLSVQHLWTHFIFSITLCDRHQNLTLHVRRLRSSPQGGSGCGCARSEDSVREPAPSSFSMFHIGIPSFRESCYVPAISEKDVL